MFEMEDIDLLKNHHTTPHLYFAKTPMNPPLAAPQSHTTKRGQSTTLYGITILLVNRQIRTNEKTKELPPTTSPFSPTALSSAVANRLMASKSRISHCR